MNEKKKIARTAGLLYFLMGITGMLGILYVPSQIIVNGDAATTVANILANETLYRMGIVWQLMCQALFVYLVVMLHRLFKEADEHYSFQMVVLVVASVPISFVVTVFQSASLVLLDTPGLLGEFSQEQLNALVVVFFRLYENGITVAQVFWGLWLIPFGLLANKSGYMPRFIGFFLIAGGVGYVLASLGTLLLPQYRGIIGPIATIPATIGEFSAIFWLLVKGVREPKAARGFKLQAG